MSISKDTPYTVVFWAQYHPGEGETSIYSLSGKWVQVKQYYVNTGLESKDPADAFWGKVAIPASGDHPTNVSLVRPFAQLSVLVPEASYSTSYSMLDGFFVDAWWGFPNGMNLYNGQVLTADLFDVRFPASGKVNITPVDETLGEATFKRMASVYLFTNEGSTRLMDVSFTIEEDNGTQHTKILTDVPLQRNVRTVITTTVK